VALGSCLCELTPQTFAPTPPSQETIDEVTEIWKGAGGDVADETISPAGLWITAILE